MKNEAYQGAKDRIRKAERPQHTVVITKPFEMSATEVTIGQYKKFSATGYVTQAEKATTKADPDQPPPKPIQTYLNPGYAVTDDSPAAVITWVDAVAYCKWLSEQEKVTYRLPTEAEWEYACRAGTTTQYSFGDDHAELEKYGWYSKKWGKSQQVGMKPPNGFGLFDMHGNMHEWCGDFYDEKWYAKSPANDPTGPTTGIDRVLRGGHWHSDVAYCRSAYRYHDHPTNRNNDHGFRVVREIAAPTTANAAAPPLDLIALFNLKDGVAPWQKGGAKNLWSLDGRELKFDADGKPGLVKFPTAKLLDANYRLEIEFTRTSSTNGFNIDLPMSSGFFTINLDEGDRGRTGLAMSGQYTDSFHIQPNRRHRVAVSIDGANQQDTFRLELDGQPLLSWQGDRQKATVPHRDSSILNTKWPGLWIPARGSSFTFHRIQVTLSPSD